MKQRQILAVLATGILFFAQFANPAEAAIQRSADFSQGSAVGVGIYGLSYDYGLGFFSAGIAAQSPSSQNMSSPLNVPLKPSVRLLARFYELEGLSASVLGGLVYDPGQPGSRAYLTPDLGLGVAYDFRQFNVPLALRLNLTLAVSDGRASEFINPDAPSANFFQRLMFGPQTSLELAWMPTDHLEVTLGGGTLLGMRLKF